MTDKTRPDKAPWEQVVDDALRTGNMGSIDRDICKAIVLKQAVHGGTPGAQATAAKTLCQIEALLVSVTKDADAERTDEQVAKRAADDIADAVGADKDTRDALERKYLKDLRGNKGDDGNEDTPKGVVH